MSERIPLAEFIKMKGVLLRIKNTEEGDNLWKSLKLLNHSPRELTSDDQIFYAIQKLTLSVKNDYPMYYDPTTNDMIDQFYLIPKGIEIYPFDSIILPKPTENTFKVLNLSATSKQEMGTLEGWLNDGWKIVSAVCYHDYEIQYVLEKGEKE